MILSSLNDDTAKALIEFCLTDPAPAKHHITRLAMYKALSNIIAEHDRRDARCLSISKSYNLGKIAGLRSVEYINAPYPEYDMLDLTFEDESFDFCVSDQVLEHVEGNPYRAMGESIRILKPGGIFVHTTCFINPVHGFPSDFWRFTPESLSMMSNSFGCTTISNGGWGNRDAWGYIALGFKSRKIPENELNPIYQLATRNDPSVPIVTWIAGQKPG